LDALEIMVTVAAHIAAKIQIYLRDNHCGTTKRMRWHGERAILPVTDYARYAICVLISNLAIAHDSYIPSGILATTSP